MHSETVHRFVSKPVSLSCCGPTRWLVGSNTMGPFLPQHIKLRVSGPLISIALPATRTSWSIASTPATPPRFRALRYSRCSMLMMFLFTLFTHFSSRMPAVLVETAVIIKETEYKKVRQRIKKKQNENKNNKWYRRTFPNFRHCTSLTSSITWLMWLCGWCTEEPWIMSRGLQILCWSQGRNSNSRMKSTPMV